MKNHFVRSESPADAAAIHAVTVAAFAHATHSDHTEQFIVDGLRAAGALALSLVAEFNGAVVGHVAVSPVSISGRACGWYGLGPISVSPTLQGLGIGSELMREALRLLRESGAAGCVLLGDPGFYSRFGFTAEPDLVLPDVPAEYFQAISFGGPIPHGIVVYHEAFSARA